MLEERTDECRSLLQMTQSTNDGAHQVRRAMHQRSTDPIVLHVIPHEFVWVQLGRIRR